MSNLESVLKEDRLFEPPKEFSQKAWINGFDAYSAMCEKASDDPEGFWGDLAREMISWKKDFTKILNEDNAPFYKWFEDGELNVSYNCIDRHLATKKDKVAIIYEKDGGDFEHLTYQYLHDRVCQAANALKSLGVKKGDRVVIYLPCTPTAIIAMQACARIGAIHSVVFAGFSAGALRDRIIDAKAKVVITQNESVRGGKGTPLKSIVDEALSTGECGSVEKVLVYKHNDTECQMAEDRDVWWHDLVTVQSKVCEPEWMNAEDPLFILYTSGSTGKPKGVVHSTAGYLLGAMYSLRAVFDLKPESDVFWCTADVGWITGHTYICYGPLAHGATQIVFEGTPTYPDPHRFWKTIEKHKATIFYTAPTAIRALIKLDPHGPEKYDLSSLRLLGSVGEPINPEAWVWFYNEVGGGRCPLVDTWWQTETGSAMIAPIPGAVSQKPGSCTLPVPGVEIDIVDETGESVQGSNGGFLVIKRPVPSLLRTVWGDDERFKRTYFPQMFGSKYYVAGDSANRDEHGYVRIMGRVDDVLNVSGHRLGTMEIESALVANPLVAEAAVVSRPHDLKGEAVVAFVVLKDEVPDATQERKALAEELRKWVGLQIGKIAMPDDIRFGENLPKTRSGKIMRRLLRSLAKGEAITSDISTLENPQIIEELKVANM